MTDNTRISNAFDALIEELNRARQEILNNGGDAMKADRTELTTVALADAEKFKECLEKVRALKAEFPVADDDVVEEPPAKEAESAEEESAGKAPKTSFKVIFPDGTEVCGKCAADTLAMTIDKLGAKRVAGLGILVGGEPLVTKGRSLLVKYPRELRGIAGGWFVNTHSNTNGKIKFVWKVAEGLGVKLNVVKI